MQSKANEISTGQLFIFIITSQISFGILRLASNLAEKVGHDGWISVLFAGAATNLIILIMFSTLSRFAGKSILEINTGVFGKLIGTFLNLAIIGYTLYASVISIRLFSDVIKISTLPLTPGIVLTSFIIIPIIYLSWYGLKYICRFSGLKLGLLFISLAYYFLLSKYFRPTFLMPIGEAGMMKIIKGAYIPFTSFLGYELISIMYPYIKEKKGAWKYAIYGNLFTTFVYLVTIIFLTGFFGEKMLVQLQYPVFSLARAYRAPVAERLDLFFIALWFPIMLTAVQLYFFSAYHSLKIVMNIEDDKRKCKILLAVYTIVVIILSRQPKDMITVYKLFDYLGYMGMAYIGYIFLCYLISFMIPGGKKNETST